MKSKRRIYQMRDKTIPEWGYWGDFGEIEIGLSFGTIISDQKKFKDVPHYHKKGIVFILILEGKGLVKINNKDYILKKKEVLRIAPGEIYYHIGAIEIPFSWITICTSKEPQDKVVVENF